MIRLLAICITGLDQLIKFCCTSRLDINRAAWLGGVSCRVLEHLKFSVVAKGEIPESGLVVCNHLSYLDELVLSSVTKCVILTDRKIKKLPFIGLFARLGGVLFIDSNSRTDVRGMRDEMLKMMEEGHLLTLFPEGQSSLGRGVLPFKSALFEPLVQMPHEITAAAISYHLEDGNAHDEVCYSMNRRLFPHLLNLMKKKRVEARVIFYKVDDFDRSDRKKIAVELHRHVSRLYQATHEE